MNSSFWQGRLIRAWFNLFLATRGVEFFVGKTFSTISSITLIRNFLLVMFDLFTFLKIIQELIDARFMILKKNLHWPSSSRNFHRIKHCHLIALSHRRRTLFYCSREWFSVFLLPFLRRRSRPNRDANWEEVRRWLLTSPDKLLEEDRLI